MESNRKMRNQKVWVVNFAGHDYTEAEHFGKIEKLTIGYVSMQSLDRVKFDLTKKIKEETDSLDYLLLSGKPFLCAVAATAWLYIHGRVKLLIHDQKDSEDKMKYRKMEISQKNFLDILDALDGEKELESITVDK